MEGSEAACRAVAMPTPSGPGIGMPYVGSKSQASPLEITAGIQARTPRSGLPVASITPSSPACRSNSRKIHPRCAGLARPESRISPGRNQRVPGVASVAAIGGSLTRASDRTVQRKILLAMSRSSTASPRAVAAMSASHRWSRSALMSVAASNTELPRDSILVPPRSRSGRAVKRGSTCHVAATGAPAITAAWLHWLSRSKTCAKADSSS